MIIPTMEDIILGRVILTKADFIGLLLGIKGTAKFTIAIVPDRLIFKQALFVFLWKELFKHGIL